MTRTERVARAIEAYFVEHTGFMTRDGEGIVSALYGGHWIQLDSNRIATAALTAIDEERDAWQPIETLPPNTTVLLGSYYDNFVLRPPFKPIWQTVEGHSYEFNGEREFSLRGRLESPPTHWRALLDPPPYSPSQEQQEIARSLSSVSREEN